ncbi:MAG TPA: hypothetical protein VFK02_01820 [Kofleriaceae bacterium]|nr:hypothetical protein [Kofleriaceae bacterium]
MLRLILVASLLTACRISLENEDTGNVMGGQVCKVSTSSQPCADAVNHSDLAWIEANVFNVCVFSGCHNGDNTRQGKIDLRPGQSYAHLVNYASGIDTTRKLVVPSDVAASYLMLMLRDLPPDMASPPANPPPGNVGYMPQGNATLCCQKLDALERWIMAGAPSM